MLCYQINDKEPIYNNWPYIYVALKTTEPTQWQLKTTPQVWTHLAWTETLNLYTDTIEDVSLQAEMKANCW